MNEEFKFLGKRILQAIWKNKRKALFIKPAEYKRAVDWYLNSNNGIEVPKSEVPKSLKNILSYVFGPLAVGCYLGLMSGEGPRSETYQAGPLKVTEHCRLKSTVFDNYGLDVLAGGYFPIPGIIYYANKKSIYGEECLQVAELEKIVNYDIHIDDEFSHTVEDTINCYASSKYGMPITADGIRTTDQTVRKFCQEELEKYEQELAAIFEK